LLQKIFERLLQSGEPRLSLSQLYEHSPGLAGMKISLFPIPLVEHGPERREARVRRII
jgi:hypothetical protein